MNTCTKLLVGATAAVAIAASAVADLVVFENEDGAFVWQQAHPDFPEMGNWLDITQPATQSGGQVPHGLQSWYLEGMGSDQHWTYGIWGSAQAKVARSGTQVMFQDAYGDLAMTYPLATFSPGEAVDASSEWVFSSDSAIWGLWMGWLPMLGESAIIGIRIEPGTGTHYGWIELAWQEVPNNNFMYVPVRWAYNTTVGEAAMIPSRGACCVNGAAVQLYEAECATVGGVFHGEGVPSHQVMCQPACAADLNGDGVVDVTDLLQLLGVWGSCL